MLSVPEDRGIVKIYFRPTPITHDGRQRPIGMVNRYSP